MDPTASNWTLNLEGQLSEMCEAKPPPVNEISSNHFYRKPTIRQSALSNGFRTKIFNAMASGYSKLVWKMDPNMDPSRPSSKIQIGLEDPN